MADADALALLDPLFREIPMEGILNFRIFPVSSALVPKPVGNKGRSLGRNAEGKAVIQIIGKGHLQIIGLKGVEGNVDLVQASGGKQPWSQLWEHRSIGCENDLEPGLRRQFQKIKQQGMTEGLSHEMEVKVICERT